MREADTETAFRQGNPRDRDWRLVQVWGVVSEVSPLPC